MFGNNRDGCLGVAGHANEGPPIVASSPQVRSDLSGLRLSCPACRFCCLQDNETKAVQRNILRSLDSGVEGVVADLFFVEFHAGAHVAEVKALGKTKEPSDKVHPPEKLISARL